VGAALASINLAMLPKDEPGNEVVGPMVFEAQLRDRKDPSKRDVFAVKNVMIHPPSAIPVPGERSVETAYITYDVQLVRKDDVHHADPYPRQMILEQHTPRDKSMAGALEGLNMRDYLDRVKAALEKVDKAKHPKAMTFTYKFAWIETPKGAYPVYGLGGLVVVGLIWPTILQFLVSAGFGHGPAEDDEFNLAKYKPGKTGAGKARAVVTDKDMDQLAQLEAELEAKLKDGALAETGDAPARAKPAAAPVPVLSAGPLEAPKEEAKARTQPKGYGADQGDYYPTEVHGKKKA
jgi:hypothetical protein